MSEVERALMHAGAAMADLEIQTGDARHSYTTRGLTNWIPTLATDVRVLAAMVAAAMAASPKEGTDA